MTHTNMQAALPNIQKAKPMKTSNCLRMLVIALSVFGCAKPAEQPPKEASKTAASAETDGKKISAPMDEAWMKEAPSAAKAPSVNPIPDEPLDVQPTPVELVRHETRFKEDKVNYAVFAPSDATIKSTQTPIYIDGGPRFHMTIGLGKHDLEKLASDMKKTGEVKIISRTEDVLLLKKQILVNFNEVKPVDTVVFFMNRSFGHRNFMMSVEEQDPKSKSFQRLTFTLADCKTMIHAAEQMTLAEELPEDPAAILEKFGASLRRDMDNVTEVKLWAIRTTDATLPLLKKFPSLVRLDAQTSNLQDRSLAGIAELTTLKSLDLRDLEVTPEGISNLKALTQLTDLSLGGRFNASPTVDVLKKLDQLPTLEQLHIEISNLTDETLSQLPVLPNLVELHLAGNNHGELNGSGLAHLAKFPKLTKLQFSLINITDDGLKSLGSCEAVTELSLTECQKITNAGIAHLVSLKQLAKLSIWRCEIDDAAIESLSQLKSVRKMSFGGLKISDAGREKLQTALPDCKIN